MKVRKKGKASEKAKMGRPRKVTAPSELTSAPSEGPTRSVLDVVTDTSKQSEHIQNVVAIMQESPEFATEIDEFAEKLRKAYYAMPEHDTFRRNTYFFHHLADKYLGEVLLELPACSKITPQRVKKLTGRKKSDPPNTELRLLFYFVMNVSALDKVVVWRQLLTVFLLDHYEKSGRPLQDVVFLNDGRVDWQRFGMYTITKDGLGHPVAVARLGGPQVRVSSLILIVGPLGGRNSAPGSPEECFGAVPQGHRAGSLCRVKRGT